MTGAKNRSRSWLEKTLKKSLWTSQRMSLLNSVRIFTKHPSYFSVRSSKIKHTFSRNHVFLSIDAPWCGHCKKLAPIWDELAEKFKEDKSLVIAKMDATKNEVENIEVNGFPTLKWFPKNSDEVMYMIH